MGIEGVTDEDVEIFISKEPSLPSDITKISTYKVGEVSAISTDESFYGHVLSI